MAELTQNEMHELVDHGIEEAVQRISDLKSELNKGGSIAEAEQALAVRVRQYRTDLTSLYQKLYNAPISQQEDLWEKVIAGVKGKIDASTDYQLLNYVLGTNPYTK